MASPRPSRLRRLIGGQTVRLSSQDRAFFRDLARVGMVCEADANTHHFAHRKTTAAHRLDRLCEAGLLSRRAVRTTTGQVVRTYAFASQEIAGAWGGYCPNIGARRNAYHELVVSRLYFSLDRPADYRVAMRFNDEDLALFGAAQSTRPDALYTDQTSGELVVVEADSGHYTKAQVAYKQSAWRGYSQVWGQPKAASYTVPAEHGVALYQY